MTAAGLALDIGTEAEGTLDSDADKALRDRLDAPPAIDRAACIRAAAEHGGNGWLTRMWRVSRGPGRINSNEFFYYGLYDPALSLDDALRFVGKRAQNDMHTACNDARWYAVCHDKALFYTTVRGAGLATPETVAVYADRGRSGYPAILRSPESLSAFLAANTHWPLFAKPIDGMYSIGSLNLLGRDGDTIRLKGAGAVRADALAAYMSALTSEGYLLQRVLQPHRVLAKSFGETLASVRLLIFWSDRDPVLDSAVIKIPRQANVADNYWRGGNMLGAIDAGAGRIDRVVTGYAESLSEIDNHPETGAGLRGLVLPDWSALVSMGLEAARLFPGIRTQSWDVALTTQGPVLLEFNFGGDLNLHQLSHGRGALRPSFADHLRRCGYKGRLP